MTQTTLNKNWPQQMHGLGMALSLMLAPASTIQADIPFHYSIPHLLQDSIITNPASSKSLNLIGENKFWEETRFQHIKSLRGKYKNKLTPSEEFAKNKLHEIRLEG